MKFNHTRSVSCIQVLESSVQPRPRFSADCLMYSYRMLMQYSAYKCTFGKPYPLIYSSINILPLGGRFIYNAIQVSLIQTTKLHAYSYEHLPYTHTATKLPCRQTDT